MKLFYVLVLSTLLSACTALGLLSTLTGSKPAVEVNSEIVAGDKHEEIALDVGTKQTAETIINTQENNPWLLMMLMVVAIVGWVAPTPQSMWKYFIKGKSTG